MQRLVYNPSVSAWIDSAEKGKIIDISEYIVSGSVTRNINEVSTAELTIRNPDKKFTKPGRPTFRPMDAITIWMNRYKNRPVQVFTGFLDKTPYLQLHPGVCQLQASCTLKRLQYTYFDPGLSYTRAWLRQYDWIMDPSTGTARNQNAQQTDSKDLPARLTDGGIGDLLYGTLKDIGNWKNQHIYIEDVPSDLAKTLERIEDSFREDKDKARKELETFLHKMIGSVGGGGTISDGDLSGGPNMEKIYNYFVSAGFSDKAAASITGNFEEESNCDPTVENSIGAFGIAQWYQGRRTNLESFAESQGKSPSDLKVQLDFTIKELNESYRSVRDFMKGDHSISEYTYHWCMHYEVPGESYCQGRESTSQAVYDKYASKGYPGDDAF